MSSVLYRKYRPTSFSELKGQETIKDILTYSIVNDSFSHGYLFSGPRGTGKTTTARLFARAVNDSEFSKNQDLSNYLEDSVDIIEMDAASNRGIDEIRELRDSIQFMPAELKYKVYIIDEAHMLTKEAFNALLKTLEEPPSHVIFIMATTEPHKVPVTILSRVTRLDFKLADESQLIDKITNIAKAEKLKIHEEALRQIYKLSGGSFRDAETILSKLLHSNENNINLETVNNVFGLLPIEEYEKLLGLLKEENYSQIKEIISKVEDSNVGYMIEGLLEYIVESGSHKEYIPVLLDILKNIKNFRDKKVYILAKLYENSLKVPVSNLGQKVVNIVDEKKDSEVPKVKEINSEINDIDEKVCESVSKDIEKVNKRLGAILKICEFKSFNEGVLVLGNKYKFNISYLTQAANKKMIIETFSKYAEVKDIKFEKVSEPKDSNLKSSKSSVDEKVKGSNEPLPEEPEDIKATAQKEPKEEKKEEEFDNSDLVESIL